MKFKFLIFAILIFALFVRFFWLDKVPSSLYYDEIDLGYQVRSLSQTGKDYRGGISPFYLRSFNTDKTPLPILISAILSPFFSSPEYQVRAGTATVGLGAVFLSMIIAFQLSNSNLFILITGLVFAASPWHIHFSRIAFEAEFALFFLFLFVSTFFHWLKNNKSSTLYFSAVVLGLSLYTYRTMSLLSPLIVIAVLIIFFKDFYRTGYAKVAIWLTIFGIFTLPFIYATTIGSKDQTRISQISIFSDPRVPILIQRHREVDSGDFQNPEVGSAATLKSKIFFNKAIAIFEKYRDNTFLNFSPEFLFLRGDANGRHSSKNSGELIFIDILALVAGGVYLGKQIRNRKFLFVATLLFLGAIPANLTIDGANHASRLITFSGPLLIVVALGYFVIFQNLKNTLPGKLLLLALASVWLFAVLQFLNKYFYHFPIENHREFGYGYKQAIQKISTTNNTFKKIYLTSKNDPPMLYYLFWSNTSPIELQKYGTEFGLDVTKGHFLDTVKPLNLDTSLCDATAISKLQPDAVYVVAYEDIRLDFRGKDKDLVPQGVKLIDTVLYPNNEPAYYLVTRDTKNGKVVDPLKTQKCK